MDVDDIDSGRFENVILNQIGMREHFILLLTTATANNLGSDGDWVSKELDRALELGKNVVPVLVDETREADVSPSYSQRADLLRLNFARLTHDLFDQAVAVLVERFLAQPTLQELHSRTAEEHYEAGLAAEQRQDWAAAESEYTEAITLRTRPEYLNHRAIARHALERMDDALNDINAAISLDPFAFQLVDVKSALLQEMDRMKEAIDLIGDWHTNAASRATVYAKKVVQRLDAGSDIAAAVRSIPELVNGTWNEPEYIQIRAALEEMYSRVSGDLGDRIEKELDSWKQAHDESPAT